MGNRNARAFEVRDYDDLSKPGAYLFTTDHGDPEGEPPRGLNFGCPCGCGAIGGLNFAGRREEPTWTVSGEWPNASLSPSIGFYGHNPPSAGHHWHGYLRNGVFEEC
jgi:hypothetical protein